ncbi:MULTISPECIES: complex I 24 kDa subunit family protein [Aminobacterium]|uniref:NADH-quinone oxidoreductase subunit NuoE family protein n=2 Tax=Aminobacteriaceae TaxID=3029087 RepID=UPI00257AB54E|nr:NAD(P)H-dependent oxidoreductase subunit E [Aminobacterium sp. UBA4834]
MTDLNVVLPSDDTNRGERDTDVILSSYPREPRFLLPILQDIQKAFRYLPISAMKKTAAYLNIPESRVYSMGTFYKAFSLTPRGEKTIRICGGTACHLRGGAFILREVEKRLNISVGETTPDRRFTLETVNCLGACALAPVIMVNEKVYGQMTPALVAAMLEEEEMDHEIPSTC